MRKRIRQGHTRWRVLEIRDESLNLRKVAVVQCLATRVTRDAVEYFDGHCRRLISHAGWMRTQPTRRKAERMMRELVAGVDRTYWTEFVLAWGDE